MPIPLGCIGVLLALPVLALYILPFVFEFYMLKSVLDKTYSELIGKVSFYLTIYINVIIIYYYIKVSLTNFDDLKTGKV